MPFPSAFGVAAARGAAVAEGFSGEASRMLLSRLGWLVSFAASLIMGPLLSAQTAITFGDRVEINDVDDQLSGRYSSSHALLIGISDYVGGWPDLASVPEELTEIEGALRTHGFHVEKHLDLDSINLGRTFETFIDAYGRQPEARLLFFFAGHGHTGESAGERTGYLVPSDAPNPNTDRIGFREKALALTRILEWSADIQAKHAIFLFDSCFSGQLFDSRTAPPQSPQTTGLTTRPVRFFITSGGADERTPSRSVFAPSLVRALEGEADLLEDGCVTATELGTYLKDKVMSYRKGQTPQFGNITDPGLDGDEFVFPLPRVGGGLPRGAVRCPDPLNRRPALPPPAAARPRR